jgi:hypothetical protein
MIRYLEMSRRYLWLFIEVVFLVVVLSVLIHVVLGPSSGGFVKDVYDNLVAFGNAVPGATLLGIGALMLLVWYIQQRMNLEKK